ELERRIRDRQVGEVVDGAARRRRRGDHSHDSESNAASRSHMERTAVDRKSGFLDRLGERRMREDRARQVFTAGSEGHSDHGLGDELAGPGTYHVHPEYAVGFLVSEDLDATVGVAKRSGTAVGREREAALAERDAALAQLLLGCPYRADL